MRNIKIIVQYDGTRYSGWQSQEHDENTIQGKLTAVLTRLLGEAVELAGSGRTDAGVHALGQVANFKTRSEMSCVELLENLNHYLPEDIGVISIEEVDARFHSRLNAVRKTYRYHMTTRPSVPLNAAKSPQSVPLKPSRSSRPARILPSPSPAMASFITWSESSPEPW